MNLIGSSVEEEKKVKDYSKALAPSDNYYIKSCWAYSHKNYPKVLIQRFV